jgi:regulator of protease activity HflC (stomatin/prohibitin superfamily)
MDSAGAGVLEVVTFMAESVWILIAVAIVAIIAVRISPLKRVLVYEYQQALRYRKGRYMGTIGPGQYWIFARSSAIVPVDTHPEFITIQGQDVLSADGVTLKVSLAAQFQVADPHVAINKNANFRTSLYLSLQMALREIVGGEKIESILDNRAGISAKLMELTSEKGCRIRTYSHFRRCERHDVPRRDEKSIRASSESPERRPGRA